jgi:agmatinase
MPKFGGSELLSLRMLGCDADYKEALVVLFGAPFDGTVSFRPGSRFGPQSMRQDSIGMETYSPYIDLELNEQLVCDLGDLDLPMGNKQTALEIISRCSEQIAFDGKIPFMLGGEHLVTLGSFSALLKRHPDLCLLHLDAHTDLRQDYLGEKLSHATVVRRIWELTGKDRIFQMGIRSGTKEEFDFAKSGQTDFNPFNFNSAAQVVEKIGKRPVYLSVDLDVYDPSVFPGTGTPEPGGIVLNDFIELARAIRPLHLVGVDLVELSPHYDTSGISTAIALTTMRELLLTIQKQYTSR